MSETAKHIEDLFKNFSDKDKKYNSICKVISVNETDRTCELKPINGDAERTGRLQTSLQLTTGIYIKPSIDSFVLLSWINQKTGIISQFSEIDEILITIGESEFQIIDGTITMNGGFLGGLCVPDLVADRLNIIEGDINDLKTIFATTWIPAPGDGGTALKTAAATWSGVPLIESSEDDINNEDILQ